MEQCAIDSVDILEHIDCTSSPSRHLCKGIALMYDCMSCQTIQSDDSRTLQRNENRERRLHHFLNGVCRTSAPSTQTKSIKIQIQTALDEDEGEIAEKTKNYY